MNGLNCLNSTLSHTNQHTQGTTLYITLASFQFDLDVDSSQLGYEVTKDVRHRYDIYLTTVLTKLALPFWLDVG